MNLLFTMLILLFGNDNKANHNTIPTEKNSF